MVRAGAALAAACAGGCTLLAARLGQAVGDGGNATLAPVPLRLRPALLAPLSLHPALLAPLQRGLLPVVALAISWTVHCCCRRPRRCSLCPRARRPTAAATAAAAAAAAPAPVPVWLPQLRELTSVVEHMHLREDLYRKHIAELQVGAGRLVG